MGGGVVNAAVILYFLFACCVACLGHGRDLSRFPSQLGDYDFNSRIPNKTKTTPSEVALDESISLSMVQQTFTNNLPARLLFLPFFLLLAKLAAPLACNRWVQMPCAGTRGHWLLQCQQMVGVLSDLACLLFSSSGMA